MEQIKIKVGCLNVPAGLKAAGNSLKVDDSGRILTLRVAYYPSDFEAWNPHDDVFIDQYIGKDDAQIRDFRDVVDLEKAVQDTIFQLNKSYAPKSAEIVFQSGARGTFSIEKEVVLCLHYHSIPQLEKVKSSIPYIIQDREPKPDLTGILDSTSVSLSEEGYRWHTERSGCYSDKSGVNGLSFVMFTLEKGGEKVLTSTAHLPLSYPGGIIKNESLYNQTVLHVEDPFGRQIILALKKKS